MTFSSYFPLKTQIILYHSFLHLHSQSLFISPSSSLPLPNSRLLPTSSSSHFNLFSIFSFRIRNTWDFNHQFEKNKKLTEFSILPAVIFCGFLIWNIQMNWDKNEVNLWWVFFYVSFFANQTTENEINQQIDLQILKVWRFWGDQISILFSFGSVKNTTIYCLRLSLLFLNTGLFA